MRITSDAYCECMRLYSRVYSLSKRLHRMEEYDLLSREYDRKLDELGEELSVKYKLLKEGVEYDPNRPINLITVYNQYKRELCERMDQLVQEMIPKLIQVEQKLILEEKIVN